MFPFKTLILFLVACSGASAALPLERAIVREAAENYRQGKWLTALERFQTIAVQASEPEAVASANFYAGECSLQLGRHAMARDAYQEVLNSPAGKTYHPRSTYRLAEIAHMSGNTADAELVLRQFLSRNPHDSLAQTAYILLGNIAAEANQSEKAIALYQAAINYEPREGSVFQAQLGMARVLLANGKTNQISSILGSLTQSEVPSIRLQALLLRGRAEYDMQQFERALATFRLAYQIPESNQLATRAHLAAGWSLWKLSRYEEIAAELGQIPSDSTLASEHHYLLGMAAYSSSNWTSAIREFTQSIADVSSSIQSSALYYLGESCLRTEQYTQAKQWLIQLVENHGESEWADDAVWTLARLARNTDNFAEFEQASELLRSHYPSSDYLRILDVQPWDKQSDYNPPAEGTLGSNAFEEAVALERDGYFDAALAAYAEFIAAGDRKPLRAEALWRIARLHDRLRHRSEAATVLTQLLAEFPQFERSTDSLLKLARLEADLGNQTSATSRHKEVLEKFPQSPQAEEAAYWLALAAADGKDSEAAQWYLGELLNLSEPKDSVVSERSKLLRAEAVCLKCQLAEAEQRWQEVSDLVNSAGVIEAGPTSARLAYWGAEAEFRLGKHLAAREKFAEVQLLAVGMAESWIPMIPLRQAQLAARQHQWKRVAEIVNELDDAYPEFELAYESNYLRGRALAGLGRMAEARLAYQEVLQNELTLGTETAAMAQWMIGETFFHQHDYENAQAAYHKVLLDHHFPEWQSKAALQEGKCTELQGHWQEASELYKQALEKWHATGVAEQLAGRLKWAVRQATLSPSTLRK